MDQGPAQCPANNIIFYNQYYGSTPPSFPGIDKLKAVYSAVLAAYLSGKPIQVNLYGASGCNANNVRPSP
jgi:hypothetical protein